MEKVREVTDGEGVPVVYESIGKTTFRQSLDCLRPMGILASYGHDSGPPEADRVYEMLSDAAYALEREVPDERLALADRIWFGNERPFRSTREAWKRLEDELERWETELEAERSELANRSSGSRSETS